jgi:GDP-4-dehydro-6-deoxy-D-mannose reductase
LFGLGGVHLLKVLITGIAGFAGSHLAEHVLKQGDVEVGGIVLPGLPTNNIEHFSSRLHLFSGDLADSEFVRQLFIDWQPDLVFHLAAQAVVHMSWAAPAQTLTSNILPQVYLLEAARALPVAPKVLVVGSGDEYGLVRPDELPVGEGNAFRPTTPYSVSKIAQDMLGYEYFLSHHLPVIRVRPFNHIGPRQSDGFATSSFAKQIAAAELGLGSPVIRVGNLEARRDFTDVRDIVRAYWLALTVGLPGEVYNLGSGRSRRVSDALDVLLTESRVSVTVEKDPLLLRPSDVPDVVCDVSRFHQATGWEPHIPFEQSLIDLLDWWRERLRKAG